jgi:hypothetical protein
MNQSNPMPSFSLEDWFSILHPIPPREPEAAKRGKESFLIQARSMTKPVSKAKDLRHIVWIDSIKNHIFKKEFSPMYVTIASVILTLSLMFGGTGATVLAAQASLPNQYLYQVKTLSEDLALRYSQRDGQRLQMELEYANRRVNEMVAMAEMGVEPPGTVLIRLETHLDQVLNLAARTESVEMIRVLSQIRERLKQQIRSLDEAPAVGPLMIRTMAAVQLRLRWVELGLNEPKTFQEQSQLRNRFNQPPELGDGYGIGPSTEHGSNSYGPGPGKGSETQSGPHMESDPPGFSPGPGPNHEQGSGSNPDQDQKPEDVGQQTGPNPNPGQNPENDGSKSGPGSDQNCSDPNPDSGPADNKSKSNQDSGGSSGREGGNRP